MGLKGYRLWVMGQLDSNLRRPTSVHWSALSGGTSGMITGPRTRRNDSRAVALQGAYLKGKL
jgi:hypothetical protein